MVGEKTFKKYENKAKQQNKSNLFDYQHSVRMCFIATKSLFFQTKRDENVLTCRLINDELLYLNFNAFKLI